MNSTVAYSSRPSGGDTVAASPASIRGRFQIIKAHARGGLGQVSLARDRTLNREVAIKEIRDDQAQDPVAQQRFLAEAEVTGQLEHPGIVPVYVLERDENDRPYYAMRFVHGRTLEQAIRQYHAAPAPLAFRELLTRFVDVCQAIAYAHSRGVIHRDLKPSNIMLGEYGETQVLDWGLAKRLRPEESAASVDGETSPQATSERDSDPWITQAGQVLGTPAYMSPEQAAGRVDQLGPATDIYSLGAALYTLLVGRAAYEALPEKPILSQVLAGPPPPPVEVNRSVPRVLDAICRKAMARDPSERYATAGELAGDIERLLADEPVEAYREPPLARLGRWMRRHKPMVAGVGALLVSGIVALSVSTWLIVEEQSRTQEALIKARVNLTKLQATTGKLRRTMERWFTRVAEDKLTYEPGAQNLAQVPHMDPVRRALLEDALVYYKDVLENEQPSPALIQETWRAHRRIGFVYSKLGEHEKAEQIWREAAALQENLVGKQPGPPLFRWNLAASYLNIGDIVQELGRLDETEREYRKGIQLLEKVTVDMQGNDRCRRDLSVAYSALGLLMADLGRPEEAEAEYRKAIEIQEDLVVTVQGMPDYRQTLAYSYNNLANVLKDTGRPERAETSYRDAIAIEEDLVSEYPQVQQYRDGLAMCLRNLARHLAADQPDEATRLHRRSIDLLKRLVADFPGSPSYRLDLGLSQLHLATVLTNTTGATEAETICSRAVEDLSGLVEQFPEVPDYHSALGSALERLARLKRGHRATAEAQELLQRAVRHQRTAVDASPRREDYPGELRRHYRWLVRVLLDQRDHAAAADTVKDFVEALPKESDGYVQAVDFLADCIELAEKDTALSDADQEERARKYAHAAIELLQTSIERSYLRAEDLSRSSFDPIRRHKGFRSLLAADSVTGSRNP